MNGNVTLIDNAKNGDTRRSDFTIIQNVVIDLLTADSSAFACYCLLRRRAGSEYNVTVKNIARDIGCTPKSARRALDELKHLQLLEEKADKDISGKTRVEAADGSMIPNNCRIYTLYAVPKGQETKGVTFTPPPLHILPSDDFTADIEQAERQDIEKQVASIEKTPPETLAKITTLGRSKEMRMAAIKEMAAANGLYSEAQQQCLIKWLIEYNKAIGTCAPDDVVNYMANMLSNDIHFDLRAFIMRQKP